MGKQKYFIDIGDRFSRLKVIAITKNKDNRTRYKCECDCGNVVCVEARFLFNGDSMSCGCFARETFIKRNTKHGGSKTRVYKIWEGMKARCNNSNNPSFEYYGKRNISICDEWEKEFMNFYSWAMSNGYRDDLTIERINNDGNYEPSNCKWATPKEQNNNTRHNRIVEYEGNKFNLTQLSEKYNIPFSVLKHRLNKNWGINVAIKTPVRNKNIMLDYNGMTKTLSTWCTELNLNRWTVWSRINKQNWSIEKALSTPVEREVSC